MLSRSPASGPAKPRHPLLAASLDIYPVGNGDQTLLPPGVTQLWDAPQPPPRHRGFCAGEGLKQHKSLPSVAQAEIISPLPQFPRVEAGGSDQSCLFCLSAASCHTSSSHRLFQDWLQGFGSLSGFLASHPVLLPTGFAGCGCKSLEPVRCLEHGGLTLLTPAHATALPHHPMTFILPPAQMRVALAELSSSQHQVLCRSLPDRGRTVPAVSSGLLGTSGSAACRQAPGATA